MRLDRTVAEVAALLGARVEGPADRLLAELQSLERAGPGDLAPVFGTRAAAGTALAGSRAGALLAAERAELPEPASPQAGQAPRSVIRVQDADLALDALVLALVPDEEPPPPGVHASAVLGPGVVLGPGASIGAHAVVGRGARLGARTRLMPGACVGEHAVLGDDCVLHPHVVIGSRCRLGDRVTVHAGSVIGKDGFGFRQDRQGRHARIPQRGIVVLGDDVEVGALCTIDRARFTETRVGNGCKLDNHVHLAHNVELGEHCAFAAQVGVAGSTVLGARVLIGGHSGVGNGLRSGERANIGGFTGVMEDIAPGSFVVGFPAVPHRTWARDVLQVRRLAELVARVRALELAPGAARPVGAAAVPGAAGGADAARAP
ncbi:MAG TPA: UDP-3-O-(3-hydroxymyristoyl)glucosamine N-acyltransferase, partial [Planctomycetota bacterium]|nr:UDP-3-O-(3-hydroxymyristoyl)glucosamine N-acyltransferase [Planctomycetota bacterium]